MPTSFLTPQYLQSLVTGNEVLKDAEDQEGEESRHSTDDNFRKMISSVSPRVEDEDDDGRPAEYTMAIEDLCTEDDDKSNLRQVCAKLLDFNWVFSGNNAEKFIGVLAETDNDEIFAQDQIRVLIMFLWDSYYVAIMKTLFWPFVIYSLSYSYYVTFLSMEHSNEFSWKNCLEWACLVIAGKCYITFVLLEVI